ncbi:hypothetical protein GCM10011341_37110 [Frigidibacter albus]|nr:hypothetical protein GCM10011341_37110 [Frigidibacter albus]
MPGSDGISRLTRCVGPHWARWIALAGKRVPAAQALSIGLVHEVHPAERFTEKVDAFCARLADLPPEALALAKLSIELCRDLDRTNGRIVERMSNAALFVGAEHAERLAAYRERLARKTGD